MDAADKEAMPVAKEELHTLLNKPTVEGPVRYMLMRCTPMRYTPMRCTLMRYMPMRCTPMKYKAMRCTP